MGKSINVSYVDDTWYLENYPDVAAAGVDPKLHFKHHGRNEGRLPCFLPAIPFERDLWAHALSPSPYIHDLEKQALGNDVNAIYAQKVLAEFYLFQEEFEKSIHYSLNCIENVNIVVGLINETVLFLTAFEAAFRAGRKKQAKALLSHKYWPKSNSKLLAHQMIENETGSLANLNKIYKKARLIQVETKSGNVSLDSLQAKSEIAFFRFLKRAVPNSHKVSVIVPVYNAADSLHVTLDSLLAQTWQDLEIIIVDDCSTDNSASVAQEYTQYSQVKFVSNESNLGAYPTRNKGVKLATGAFITVMDSDDWAHPQKIEMQVLPLLNNNRLIGSVSHWVRCNKALNFSRLRPDFSWIYRNVSSLMVRSSVFENVGYWDELKAGADTEFYLRLIANYTDKAILEVLPDVPLSLGRVHGSSLTQSLSTHLVTQFGGVRQEHLGFAKAWHYNSNRPVKLNVNLCEFPVPTELCSEPSKRGSSLDDLRRWRTAFNGDWYQSNYRDVNETGSSIYEHFWSAGEALDYSPSPLFVPSAYRFKEKLDQKDSPTWQAIRRGWEFTKAITLTGSSSNTGTSIAMFAHSVSPQVFGAELSFLDAVKAGAKNGFRITVFLPNATNVGYINSVLKYVERAVFLPLPWFRKGRKSHQYIIDCIFEYLEKSKTELCYVNTVMLQEPYEAAKKAGVKTVTHIRELPEYDEHIRGLLGEDADEVSARLESHSEFFIANSELTANWLRDHEDIYVLPNKVNLPTETLPIDLTKPLKICMVSSNTQKKGIEDFYYIAKKCSHKNIEFYLYGPDTADVSIAEQKYPGASVVKCGYVKDINSSISDSDIVLCLSWFKESFGRTAAEAMANGRVVFGYRHGAIPEVLGDGCGVLFPHRNPQSIVEKILEVSKNKECLKPYSIAARSRAEQLYSEHAYNEKFNQIVLRLLTDKSSHT